MKRILTALAAVLALALVPGAASAKQAVASTSGFPPGGLHAGQTWNPLVSVSIDDQPVVPAMWTGGQMPRPQIVLTERSSGKRLTTTLQPTGKPGQFSGAVTFPRSGRWSYQLVSNYGDRVYQYPAVDIRAAPGGVSLPAIGGGLLAAMAAAAGALLLWRRRGTRPAPVMRPA